MPAALAPAAPAAPSAEALEDNAAIDALESIPEPTGKAVNPPPAPPAAVAPPEPAPAAPKPPEAAKPALDDIEDLPVEPRPEPVAPKAQPAAPSVEPKTIPEVRRAYETFKTENQTLKAEAAELRRQIDAAKQAGDDTKALRDELAGITKERTELADKIRFLNYRESGEFQEKYQKPLQTAWEAALTDIDGMVMDREDGTQEKVTATHLTQLLQMPAGQAAAAAAKMFGPAAPEILAHRRAIIGLQKASESALTEWKTKGSELSAAQERHHQESMSNRITSFNKGITDARETMPDIFGRPKDPEAAALFDKADKLVALAFKGEGLDAGLTPDQQSARIVSAQASLAARAASFGPTRHALNKANARVSELEQKLKAYEASEPNPAATKPATVAAADDDDMFNAIDRLPNHV